MRVYLLDRRCIREFVSGSVDDTQTITTGNCCSVCWGAGYTDRSWVELSFASTSMDIATFLNVETSPSSKPCATTKGR
jgi:hypothetical protein